jgi:hypothetical protein
MMSGRTTTGFAGSTGPDNRTYKRDRDGKFSSTGGGGGATGQEALDAVPARVPPWGMDADGKMVEPTLEGPDGMGSVYALAGYEHSDYENVNGYLRGKYKAEEYRDGGARVDRQIAEIDKTMGVSRTTADIQVTRTISDGSAVFGEHWSSGDLAGMAWSERGYSSTSANPAHSQQWADSMKRDGAPEPVILSIRVPAGTGAVQLGEMETSDANRRTKVDGVTPLPSAEVMLQRGLTMTVVEDHGVGGDGVRRLVVEAGAS